MPPRWRKGAADGATLPFIASAREIERARARVAKLTGRAREAIAGQGDGGERRGRSKGSVGSAKALSRGATR